METFKGYVKQHALEQLRSRLARWPDILKQVEQLADVAKDVYDDKNSWALQVAELPEYAQTDPLDGSNGNIVVVVIRPNNKGVPSVITGFIRRSSDMPGKPQPFTPEALRVDKVATLPEFMRHVHRFLFKHKSMSDIA